MTKLADATPERIADHFVNYLFAEYYGDRHVRRVAFWVGLIVLGIEKLPRPGNLWVTFGFSAEAD